MGSSSSLLVTECSSSSSSTAGQSCLLPDDILKAMDKISLRAFVRYTSLLTLFVLGLLLVQIAHADTPVINTFTVGPTIINSGYTALFSWTGTGNGYSLAFECPEGVRATSYDGSPSPCTTHKSLSANGSIVGYVFTNLSTTTKTVRALLYPKDATGKEYTGSPAAATLTVGAGATAAAVVPVIPPPTPATTSRATSTSVLPPIIIPPTPPAPTSTVVSRAALVGTTTAAHVTAPIPTPPVPTPPKPPVPTVAPVAPTTPPAAPAKQKNVFTRSLVRGMHDNEVSALQIFLASSTSLYPERMITGYFGALTEKAVQRFQEKYDIAHVGDDGFGIVGPKTRAILNSLKVQ